MKKSLSVLLALALVFSAIMAVSAQDKTYLERAYDGEFKGTEVIFDGPFMDRRPDRKSVV